MERNEKSMNDNFTAAQPGSMDLHTDSQENAPYFNTMETRTTQDVTAPILPQPTHSRSLLQRMTPHFRFTPGPNRPIASPQQLTASDGHMPEKPLKTKSGRLLGAWNAPPMQRANVEFPEERLVTNEHKLVDFRRLIGIDSSPSHTQSNGYHRAGENRGIYNQIITEEKDALTKYKTYKILIDASMGLQLIFAAGLTALGAGDGPKSAITAFGALSTILAGFLTFLKGSGLPHREKYFADQWKKVRDYIEQREREFGRVGCNLDVDTEVHTITAMFNEVKHEIQINRPDGFTSVSTKRLQDGKSQYISPKSLEAGHQTIRAPISNHNAAPARTIETSHHGGVQNVLDKISGQVDTASKAGKLLSQLSSLNAKYGDSILEKLGHLHDNDSTQQLTGKSAQSQRDVSRAIDSNLTAGRQLAQQHVSVASDLLNRQTERLSDLANLESSHDQALSEDSSQRTTIFGTDAVQHAQAQAERVAETAQTGVDRLLQVERQAEAAARNFSSGIANEFRGFWEHGNHQNDANNR